MLESDTMSTRTIVRAGLIAALYAALTLALRPISYGPVQLRVSEALTILPVFMPEAVPGLALGCAVANSQGPIGMLDVVFGTLATVLGALGTYALRKKPFYAMACTVVANALIVPAYLPIVFGPSVFPGWFGPGIGLYFAGVVTVGLGEAVAVYVFGGVLWAALRRARAFEPGEGRS